MTMIYELSKNNVPFYIGKTSRNAFRSRKSKHKQKYGKDTVFTVIDESNLDWKLLEPFWIAQYKAWGFNLLNKNNGGGGPTKYTPEQTARRLESRAKGKGYKNNHMAWVHTPENTLKKAEALKKPILQYKDNVLIKEFKSITDASKELNIPYGNISHNIHNRTKFTRGFKFKQKL